MGAWSAWLVMFEPECDGEKVAALLSEVFFAFEFSEDFRLRVLCHVLHELSEL